MRIGDDSPSASFYYLFISDESLLTRVMVYVVSMWLGLG